MIWNSSPFLWRCSKVWRWAGPLPCSELEAQITWRRRIETLLHLLHGMVWTLRIWRDRRWFHSSLWAVTIDCEEEDCSSRSTCCRIFFGIVLNEGCVGSEARILDGFQSKCRVSKTWNYCPALNTLRLSVYISQRLWFTIVELRECHSCGEDLKQPAQISLSLSPMGTQEIGPETVVIVSRLPSRSWTLRSRRDKSDISCRPRINLQG